MKRNDIKGRFLALISKKKSGCWEWSSNRYSNGYGSFKMNYKRHLAHRISYSLFVGQIPEGMCVLHKCDNPPCVNPDHLFLGTTLDNIKDMLSKGRGAKGTRIHGAKLNEDVIRSIRDKHGKDGWNFHSLSRKYGVEPPTIEDIVKRITWAWVK